MNFQIYARSRALLHIFFEILQTLRKFRPSATFLKMPPNFLPSLPNSAGILQRVGEFIGFVLDAALQVSGAQASHRGPLLKYRRFYIL